LTKITKIKYRSSITGDVGAPQCIVVEPQVPLESQSNLLEYNENPLVVTKTYSIKWRKNGVDLVELAKRRWIDQMSYREIGKSMGITRGQVDWNLRKFRSEFSPRQNPELRKIWTEIEKERKK
jgi:riboflavin biosynthesis pyrimidine reductase